MQDAKGLVYYAVMRMIRRVPFLLVCLTVLPLTVSSLELDQEELRQVGDADLEFENFEGPVQQFDTADEIRGIGRALGRVMTDQAEAEYFARYRTFRVVGDSEEPRLAADIFEILPQARVDHINNIRRILAGYLEDAWGYSGADANLLARFITIYNAVHRGSMNIFQERYRSAVVNALDGDRVGLALSFRQWPGQTQIVVPIRDGRAPGDLDAVDPLQLIDPRVIEDLRSDPDMGIEERKEIIDFVERVIEEREEVIETERQAIEEERQEVEARIAELEEEIAATPAPAPDPDDPDPPAEPAAPTPAEEELQELIEQREALEERAEALEQEVADVTALTEEIMELYQEVAEDQVAMAVDAPEQDLVVVRIPDGGRGFQLALVDVGTLTQTSAETVPLADRVTQRVNGNVLVVHRQSRRLLLVDPQDLSIQQESDRSVVEGSIVVVEGSSIFAVVEEGGNTHVGEFSTDLVLQRFSEQPVLPDTDIVIHRGSLVVQRPDGRFTTIETSTLIPNQ